MHADASGYGVCAMLSQFKDSSHPDDMGNVIAMWSTTEKKAILAKLVMDDIVFSINGIQGGSEPLAYRPVHFMIGRRSVLKN